MLKFRIEKVWFGGNDYFTEIRVVILGNEFALFRIK